MNSRPYRCSARQRSGYVSRGCRAVILCRVLPRFATDGEALLLHTLEEQVDPFFENLGKVPGRHPMP
jgi:hypothetical protein